MIDITVGGKLSQKRVLCLDGGGGARLLRPLPSEHFDGRLLLVDDAFPELLEHCAIFLRVEKLFVHEFVFEEVELFLGVAVVQSWMKEKISIIIRTYCI